ncbi:hypothetical protein [Hymenobacter elongatus]|uniref:Outer membrane protein beta-barrel domain-containing protein n=1 Tax=Hymenobacter elongatus TaxID=877208 RepID=A0A4Z0PPD7_9BACT|nr:hypothetical protein [Hymenobacter elongatus]TGE18355.1 hypothetical protein E5J99_05495 [Hymenobacter elongatus]
MRIAALTAFLLGTVTFSQAQTFEPGLVVVTSGDTLRGEIENSYWVETPTTVRFRTVPTAEATTYDATQLRLFRLGSGRYFRSESLPVDRTAGIRNNYQTEYLTGQKVAAPKPETVFAEVLIEGPAPLLRLNLARGTHYFVRRENKDYIDLADRQFVRVDQAGQRNIITGNDYRGQLGVLFGDCAAATQAIASAAFTPAGLATVVQAYNQRCSGAAQPGTSFLKPARPKRVVVVNAGVLGGIQLNRLVFTRAESDYGAGDANQEGSPLDGVNFASRPHPIGGLYADVLLAGRAFALHADLTLTRLGQTGKLPAQGALPAGEYRWKGLLYTARTGMRYFLPTSQVRRQFFVGTGLALDYVNISETSLRYGNGQPRTGAGGIVVAGSGSFLAAATRTNNTRGLTDSNRGFPYAIRSFPYLELGLRQGRFTATLDARAHLSGSYRDELVIDQVLRTPDNVVYAYSNPRYSTRLWLFNALLGYQLSKGDNKASR